MITMLRRRVARTFGSLPWRSRSQYDYSAKSCLAHNIVNWSRNLQLFHRNDHHIETTWRMQHLVCYLGGQDHGMTLQQNRVWPKTYMMSDFTTTFDKLLLCVQYLVGEHYPVPTGSCYETWSECLSKAISDQVRKSVMSGQNLGHHVKS